LLGIFRGKATTCQDDEMAVLLPCVWPMIMAQNGVKSGRGWWDPGRREAGPPKRGLQASAVSRDSSFDRASTSLIFPLSIQAHRPTSPLEAC
jgi:hypothetical protein